MEKLLITGVNGPTIKELPSKEELEAFLKQLLLECGTEINWFAVRV